jgi:hypothetical protein
LAAYWRTQSSKHDWIVDPDFDFATADYKLHGPTHRAQFRDFYDSARMYFWLRGESDKFRLMGDQGWPLTESTYNFNQAPYGIPEGLAGGYRWP